MLKEGRRTVERELIVIADTYQKKRSEEVVVAFWSRAFLSLDNSDQEENKS